MIFDEMGVCHRRNRVTQREEANTVGWSVRKRTVGGVAREPATRLVCHRRQQIWVGQDQAVDVQNTRGLGTGCGDARFDEGAAQHSNGYLQTAMAEPQLPEHSRGSGLDHEHCS